MLEIRDLALTYPGPPPVPALRAVNLVVHTGELVAIVGPSGSGKSSLLNVLGLLQKPDSGRYSLQGTDVATLDEDKLAAIRAADIGFIFQNYQLLPHLSAIENVALAGVYSSAGQDRRAILEEAADCLHRVGLADKLGAQPSELSGGQQQRVAIARALMGSPALLLCDEPTGNLDRDMGDSVARTLRRLHQEGATIVVITHDHRLAQSCERVVTIADGRIDSDSAPALTAIAGPSEPHRAAAPTSRIALAALVGEIFGSLLLRPTRTLLTLLGSLIGGLLLVLVVGVNASASSQISSRFDALLNTQIRVDDLRQEPTVANSSSQVGFIRSVERLNGVTGVAAFQSLDAGQGAVSAGLGRESRVGGVVAVSPGFEMVAGGNVSGRSLTAGDDALRARVAVVGSAVAEALGIADLHRVPVVFVNGYRSPWSES